MLEHGGRLRAAAAHYGIPTGEWLDLSTGINPDPWPVPPLPASAWQRLPEDDDGLEAAAASAYGNPGLLPVAGSQAAIQLLPALLPRAAVACVSPLYAEHPHCWQKAGHRVRLITGSLSRALAAATPYVLLCNPNNPTATAHTRAALLHAASELKRRGGWLIVDEAFIDPTPDDSVADLAGTPAAPRLIVLRSLGKFFGLAGARVGFVLAAAELLQRMRAELGPWTVSGPARSVARLALADLDWQRTARHRLLAAGERLHDLLAAHGEVHGTALFATLRRADGAQLHDHVAHRGILTRLFAEHGLLRFGLPASEDDWQRLHAALQSLPQQAAVTQPGAMHADA
ncbi:MAG TPA: threonine-phosphate decarboxylase CobD [Candidatus Accumulibacter phosphatis]|nr:threonine-phosphate decarboxylase CobD [Candidatus Accumulibacter phosphatis]HRQ96368.1 threonine-phosphate decarboxylase CobD [Candidatus Accumulibacter phosphatis]